MKGIRLIFTALLIPLIGFNQVENDAVLRKIIKSKNNISLITNTKGEVYTPVKINDNISNEKIVKNNNGTFITIDGTGQIFKATLNADSSISYNRIDSSKFYGHSFQSIDFSYNNTLYSFGGYGFWHHNGQLRHFDLKSSEWLIDNVNKEYNTTNFLVNYLPKESIIYYLVEPKNGETTNDNITEYQIIAFDLVKKENTILGVLNNHLKLQNPKYINTPNLGGTLVLITGDYYLLNFNKNKVFKLNNSSIKDILNGKLNDPIINTFEEGDKIYFNTEKESKVQSIQLKISDFKEEPYPIYDENSYTALILTIFLITGIILVYLLYKRKAKLNSIETTDDLNQFNEVERSLIDYIITKANKNEYLNVDEVNTYLGIKRKSLEIQKKVRNESISRINHKFKVNFNQESVFIERIRSKDDKRVFNYTIHSENIKIYKTS